MSKEKRLQQKKAREKAIRREKNRKFLLIAGLILVAVLLAGGIGGYYYYNNIYLTRPVDDYSAGLSEDGYIKDIRALDYVDLCDYKNITVPEEEIQMSEDQWKEYINPILAQYGELSYDKGLSVDNGDLINIDFVGTIDGVPFEGGSTEGAGTTISLGSAGYIEGFEEQIVGHKTGENFDINVVFPEDYGVEDLNGQPAVFNITINGKYIPSEYNDEFVLNYLCDDNAVMTADEYKEQYIENAYKVNLNLYIENYILNNSTIISYPEEYLDIKKGTIKSFDLDNYKAYNEYYQSMGMDVYKKFSDYTGMSTKEYEANLSTQGMTIVKKQLIVQAIFEDANLSITNENIDEALEDFGVERQYYSNFEQRYGKGYMQQLAMTHAVTDYLHSKIEVTK